MNEEKWELLIELQSLDEAHLIIGLLRSNGIPCDLKYETAAVLFGLTYGPLARSGIYVPVSLLGKAELLLTELEKERDFEAEKEDGS